MARTNDPKLSRWPRTDRRRHRVETVLNQRQPDLTVVLENVHDPHNVSAVLRTCDAVGILRVHVVYSVETPPESAFARTTSASAAKWIDITRHEHIDECYAALRNDGFTIAAAALSDKSVDLFALDLVQPTAIVFGNEMRGLSEEATALADTTMVIPMMGMVQSLNISVACAVTLYEALRQRLLNGDYQSPKLAQSELPGLVEEWLRR